MADTYREDQVEASPSWLQGPLGAAWAGAVGSAKDEIASRAKQAVKASLPLICPADALAVIGEEVGLPRGIVEPEASYRSRLAAAYEAWVWAGTPYGLLRAFQLAGYPSVLVQCQSGKQFTLGAGGALADLAISSMAAPVHLGGSPSELWSDLAVLITKPWPTWWSGAPADGTNDQKAAAALIVKWKNAYNRCVKLTVVDGPTWGIMTWGAFTWGGGTNTVWTPPAS
jgi:hypothetical protein